MTNDKNEVYIWEQGDNHPRGWLPVDAIKTKQDHHEHYTRTAHIKQVIGEVINDLLLNSTVDDQDVRIMTDYDFNKALEKLKGLKND